jgi:acyl carrier protein
VEVSRGDGAESLEQLKRRISKKTRQEKELLIAPAFFDALKNECPWIEEVEIELKGGHHANELVKYRYDAALYVGWATTERTERRCLDWEQDGLSLEGLRRLLIGSYEAIEVLEVSGIPNSRLGADRKVLELLAEESGERSLGQLREKLQEAGAGFGYSCDVSPQQLLELGRDLGLRAQLIWPSPGVLGAYRAVFRRDAPERKVKKEEGGPVLAPLNRDWSRWERYANKPLREVAWNEQVAQWREFLASRLPAHMTPAVFVELESMPLTPNGKLDRKALPRPEQGRRGEGVVYVAARTPIEEVLAGIWAQVLGLEKVGIDDNFFEIGGHSLSVTVVVSHIQYEIGIQLAINDFFIYPTIRDLANLVEDALLAKSDSIRIDEILNLLEEVDEDEL